MKWVFELCVRTGIVEHGWNMYNLAQSCSSCILLPLKSSTPIRKRMESKRKRNGVYVRWLMFKVSQKLSFYFFYNRHPNLSWYKLFSSFYYVRYWLYTAPDNMINTCICFSKWDSNSEGVCLVYQIATNRKYSWSQSKPCI